MDESDYTNDKGFGTPPWMLRRNTDPVTSHISAELNDSEQGEEEVFQAIASFGDAGCISDDLMDYFGFEDQREDAVSYSGITGRYIALERKFFIERSGEQRIGHRFKRPQLVMRALSEKERLRRQAALDGYLLNAASPENIALLVSWWHLDCQLRELSASVEAAKQSVLDAMFPGVTTGRYTVPLYADHELIVTFMRRSTRLEVEKMSARRIRELSLSEETQITDTEDTRWNDEHDR